MAVFLPGQDPARYLTHARKQLAPGRGAGIREAAADYNRRLEEAAALSKVPP